MKLIRDIQRLTGNFELHRKLRQIDRHKRIHNFTTARSAGILFSCRSEDEFEAVKEFKQFLESEAIDTSVLGFVDDQEIPDHYLLRKGFQFFCLKDLKWSKVPGVPFVNDFEFRIKGGGFAFYNVGTKLNEGNIDRALVEQADLPAQCP